ncbi:hypothetical protein IJM86_01965 [bacterium]|nr:hypothetical protein [bacterium]
MYTSCKEDEDPGYEIVDDSVEKEASEYQKQLDKLQATFKAQNEVEAFTAEDRKTIEARFKLIQKLIDLKRTGRQVVSQKEIIPTDGNETMSIDDAITTLLNEVEGFLIGNGWRVY